jgi:trimeric autotransporter adhesin
VASRRCARSTQPPRNGPTINGTAGESNVTSIGSNTSKTFISGISGVTTGGTAVPVLVDSSGQLGVTSSSRRFKRDIRTLGESAVDALMKLQPVSFRYRASVAPGPWPLQFGLIAEQVAKVLPNLVA